MLIDIEKRCIVNTDGYNSITFGNITLHIQGFLWSSLGGEQETAEYISEYYKEHDIVPFEELYGSFSVMLRRENKIMLFTDNSNMQCYYISEHAISNRFLDVVRYEKRAYDSTLIFDKIAVSEYMLLHRIYLDRTLIHGITISNSNTYFIMDNDGIHHCEKSVSDITSKSNIESFEQYFSKLITALGGKPVLLAQTGGYDSRFVHALIQKTEALTLFMQSNNEQSLDVQCAKKVSRIMNREFVRYDGETSKARIVDETLVRQMFAWRDGQSLSVDTSSVSTFDYPIFFLSKGYTLQLTGDGGVLHKDWEWLSDFPFYNKKSVNCEKFFKQRISYEYNEAGVNREVIADFSNAKLEIMEELMKLSNGKTNTQSFDMMYYYITGNRTRNYSIRNNGFSRYAPLQELELVRYSYHLPRQKRFFNNFIREETTKQNAGLARLKTNYGTTASNETVYILRDILFWGGDCIKKVYRMLYRYAFHKTPQEDSVWIEKHENEQLRDLDICRCALEYCKKSNIAQKTIDIRSVPINRIVDFTYIYLVSEIINE